MADKKNSKSNDPVTFIKEQSEAGTNWTIIRQIQINRAFYRGYQWISWDRMQKRVYVPEIRPGEKRYTFNKIKPSILTLLSKLCKNRAELEVRPDTNDDERIEVARGSLKFLHYQWQDDDMDHKTKRLKFHMLVDGFPALKVYVDKTKGDDINLSELNEPDNGLDDLIEGDLKQKLPTKTGKIVTQVVDQLALKVDPTAEDISEIRWAMEERPMDVDEIMDIWGKEVAPEDNISQRQTFEQFMTSEMVKRYKNMAMVYDYWELPCSKYPKGRRIVVAGDQVLEMDDKDPGEFPFIFFPAIPIPGRVVADGIVTDMTTPQKSYNIKRTAEARILEEMGNPMWTLPKGSVDDSEDINNEIGGLLWYTPVNGAEPKRVQGSTVDGGWQNAMERDLKDLEDISGAHEISQGATPRGNNTYSGMALQVEQDETKLAILVQSFENGIQKWGEKVLRLVQRHFPEEQQLSIVGENGEVEAFSFAGADLSGGEAVDVVPGSSMPTVKAVEDQKIMDMWGAGMFNDPSTGQPDTKRVVRLLSESTANAYFDDSQQDENKARMENRTWEKAFEDPQLQQILMQYAQELQVYQVGAQTAQSNGVSPEDIGFHMPQPPMKLPIVRDFYDHQIHIQIHNRFRKTEAYDELPPELQLIVDQHVQEHINALQAPQMAAQAQQMQQAQMQAGAQQQAAQTQMDAQRAEMQHQMNMKQMDHTHNMEKEMIKSQTALAQAQVRSR